MSVATLYPGRPPVSGEWEYVEIVTDYGPHVPCRCEGVMAPIGAALTEAISLSLSRGVSSVTIVRRGVTS